MTEIDWIALFIVAGFGMVFLAEMLNVAKDDSVLKKMERGEGPMHYVDWQGRTHFNVNRYLRSEQGKRDLEAMRMIPMNVPLDDLMRPIRK